MSLKAILNAPRLRQVQSISTRRWFSSKTTESDNTAIDITNVDLQPIYGDEVLEEELKELQKKRNKSRLNPEHRNILFGQAPYKEPIEYYHKTLKYKRRMLGRYGMQALDVPVGVAWPTKEELEDKKEYERVAFPLSLQERWKKIEEDHKEREAYIKKREEEISEKMSKMDTWIRDLHQKREKKEKEMAAAIERKNRIIEDVRRELGGKISEYDEKFKEIFAKKEKEYKKKEKQARAEAKQKLLNAKIAKQSENTSD